MEEYVKLEDLLKSTKPGENFSPVAYYGEEEDSLMIYLKNDPDYAKRINSRVTVFLSEESDELVGCQIKNVRRVLDDIGWFDAKIKHGKIEIKLLFLSLRETFCNDEIGRECYRKLGELVTQTPLEIEVPQMAS